MKISYLQLPVANFHTAEHKKKRNGTIQYEIKPILTKKFLGEINTRQKLNEKNRESIIPRNSHFHFVIRHSIAGISLMWRLAVNNR
jgi:hypothetical protein